jgi:Asp-tRNA(Asn)/Glu-tRNA(Gln) amidotransferase C subunit
MHPENMTDKQRHYSSYAFTKAEKEIFFEYMSSIKDPYSFSSNIKRIINFADKISEFKVS